jgi:hypothetical protein
MDNIGMTPLEDQDAPTHPKVRAALLMAGVSLLIVVLAFASL